ncbi:hypothetical protein HK098_002039 [Nowakowskiella sp. JEL0407]|nr:hypothetical protein HK098_002039 [Nowakowskiella sp. JEL0407]
MDSTPAGKELNIGVLALQGAFQEHINILSRLSSLSPSLPLIKAYPVKTLEQLQDEKMDGLIIPGGESTTIALVAERTGVWDALKDWVHNSRKAVWGTCAGLILLSSNATRTKATGQSLLNLLPISVIRNGYGAQQDSFIEPITIPSIGDQPFPAVFIRAPVIEKIQRSDVEILGTVKRKSEGGGSDETEDVPVAIRQGRILATTFHPELTPDPRIHLLFCCIAMEYKQREGNVK